MVVGCERWRTDGFELGAAMLPIQELTAASPSQDFHLGIHLGTWRS
jgi:hypothetical protein